MGAPTPTPEAKPIVALLGGTPQHSALLAEHCLPTLQQLGLPAELAEPEAAISAHTPNTESGAAGAIQTWVQHAENEGILIFIVAYTSAQSPLTNLSQYTAKPVLSVPCQVEEGENGADILTQLVGMRPMGTLGGGLALGKAGASNAALSAASILAVSRPEYAHLAASIADMRAAKKETVLAAKLPQA